MILTSEDFWCPTHGRIGQAEGRAVSYDEKGGGPYIPYYKAFCKRCACEGEWVCCGDTVGCEGRVQGGFCGFHGNFIGNDAHPHGRAHSKQLAKQELQQYFERERIDQQGGFEDSDFSTRNGIF